MKKILIMVLLGLSTVTLGQCGKSEEQIKQEVKEEVKQEVKEEIKEEQKQEEEQQVIEEKGYTQEDIEGITKKQVQEYCDKFYETSDLCDKVTIGVTSPIQEGYDYCNIEEAKQYLEQLKNLQQQYKEDFPEFIKQDYNNYINKTCEVVNDIINTGNINQDMTQNQKDLYIEMANYYDKINNKLTNMEQDIK